MNIEERFKGDNIFDKMSSVSVPKGESIFAKAELSCPILFKLWIAKSGYKYCSSLAKLDSADLSQILMTMYNDKWCKVYDELSSDFQRDTVVSYSENTKGRTSIDNKETNQTNDNVSAYNDDDFTPNEQNITNTTGTNKQDRDDTRVYTRTSRHKDNFNSKTDAIRFLQKNDFFDIMFHDIDSQLCLKVYNMEDMNYGD